MLAEFGRTLKYSAAAGTLMLMAGCVNGYPSEDQPRTSALSSHDHVRALNGYLASNDGDARHRFKLATPCLLRLSGLTSEPKGRSRGIVMESMRLSMYGDKETGVFSVTILETEEGRVLLTHEFAVGKWIDAVAFRSHLQQLTMACIDESDKVET